MDGFVKFESTDVYFKQSGETSKPAVILLHGYLESTDIWGGFADRLAQNYRVVAVDLPGHGKSGVFASVHRMDAMAEAVLAVADHLGISDFHLVGHSMGGYVAMAMRSAHADRLRSYVLFHSNCFPDNDDKKASRHREIEILEQGKKDLIVNSHIPKTFAADNQDRLKDDIERAKEIAGKTPVEGIIAVLNGMIERPSTCHLLGDDDKKDAPAGASSKQIPLLLIGGKRDPFIPFMKMEEMMTMGKMVKLVAFEDSAHMGFLEEQDKAVSTLEDFFRHF